jgi:hypothetical protein
MIPEQRPECIFIDPPSPAYYQDRLFEISDPVLNRDDSLQPFFDLRAALEKPGTRVRTADYMPEKAISETVCDYYSLGVLGNFEALLGRDDIRLKAFVFLEPPVVDPRQYRALPELTAAFERVYLSNTVGDGYSLTGVDTSKLRQMYWPILHTGPVTQYWDITERLDRIVVINGNHIPKDKRNELYSARIEAMASLAKSEVVDLYGRGWERWWSRASMWLPYWKNRPSLMSVYRGSCESKYETLSRYKYCLCFENTSIKGYVTEKIFDCLYTGTIPLYLGAPNISEFIPETAYIDCRRFGNWQEIPKYLDQVTETEIQAMREAGATFLQSEEATNHLKSLRHIFS